MARKREIKAVRRVLYDRDRLRRMLDEVRSIDVLMNTGPNAAIAPDSAQVPEGGPLWYLPDGSIEPAVLEAADRCRRIASLLRETRRGLKDVDFNADDKRELRNALDAQAKAWIARGKTWSEPGPPTDVDAAVADINRHDMDSIRSYQRVQDYVDRDALERVR